jgi:hypothetical protein
MLLEQCGSGREVPGAAPASGVSMCPLRTCFLSGVMATLVARPVDGGSEHVEQRPDLHDLTVLISSVRTSPPGGTDSQTYPAVVLGSPVRERWIVPTVAVRSVHSPPMRRATTPTNLSREFHGLGS